VKQSVSFTSGDPTNTLYRMALPMVWGLLATMSFNAVDTYFVAQLGADQLAAMSFTFPVVMVITSMAIGMGAGTSSLMARLLGQSKIGEARQMAGDAILLSLALSSAMMLLGLLTIDPLFLLLGAKPELLPLIHDYMSIWYLNTPFVIASMALSATFRSTGNNGIAGTLMFVSAIFNAILDPLLIFGWGIFPRMEIAGAAWATFITRGVMTFAGLYLAGKTYRLISWPHVQWSALTNAWKGILHIALPAMGTNMIIPLASGISVALIATHGVDAVAGFGVAIRIEPIMLITFFALSGVVGPFMGQNMAGEYRHRQLQALNSIVKFCLLFGAAMAVILWLAKDTVVGWFTDSPEVIEVAAIYLTITPVSYGLYGLVMSVNASFNGLGKPFPAMAISILRALVIYLPLALVAQHFWGLPGLFIGMTAANGITGILAYFWLKSALIQPLVVAKTTA
jgi:putative MATE family efflux protein|tara:strand:- start:3327 stop:4685 length:1359 start_codon:yes stop_codon:yes gene_type:complete